MTWNLPLVKKFWNEKSHDPNDFRSTKVSREEAAFFRPMKNFVRSVWDLMSLISPPLAPQPKKSSYYSSPPPPPSAPGLKLAKILWIGNKKQEMKQ